MDQHVNGLVGKRPKLFASRNGRQSKTCQNFSFPREIGVLKAQTFFAQSANT
jgi:hypothetical protein